ncbi:MAG: cytosolic protein [Chloroflexi bacterium]|nr:cytosolic protein [Chloroflexota bacterium]
MNALLKDAYDLHVHTAPDVLPRKVDDVGMAQRVIASGMKGYAIKSHFFCTSERAQIIRKVYPGCNVVGGIALNSAVGGINPTAVEMAGRSGARIVWFPSSDAEHEQKHLAHSPPDKLPNWAKIQFQMRAEGVHSPSISILENGQLKQEVFAVLDIIARFNMVLATGHISQAETFALVKAARARKVGRIVITHVTFPSTFYSIEEQQELVKLGAFMEHCYTTPSTGKVAWQTVFDQIRAIGVDRVLLTTDLGVSTGAFPDEGLRLFAEKLLENGFSETDARTMIVRNPAFLVE